MTAQHTSEPWTIDRNVTTGNVHIRDTNGDLIGSVSPFRARTEANARLIAAAPRLLAALGSEP